jgi:hypothetical protein
LTSLGYRCIGIAGDKLLSAQYGRGKERKKTIPERAQICIFIQGDKKKLELHRKQEVQC